jgi:hypothetical protein
VTGGNLTGPISFTLPYLYGVGRWRVHGVNSFVCVVGGMVRLDDRPDDWRSDAACSWGYDPDLWFPRNEFEERFAKSVCATCPVIRECEAYARRIRPLYGIWAGTHAYKLR